MNRRRWNQHRIKIHSYFIISAVTRLMRLLVVYNPHPTLVLGFPSHHTSSNRLNYSIKLWSLSPYCSDQPQRKPIAPPRKSIIQFLVDSTGVYWSIPPRSRPCHHDIYLHHVNLTYVPPSHSEGRRISSADSQWWISRLLSDRQGHKWSRRECVSSRSLRPAAYTGRHKESTVGMVNASIVCHTRLIVARLIPAHKVKRWLSDLYSHLSQCPD